jgi:hypothetical protein
VLWPCRNRTIFIIVSFPDWQQGRADHGNWSFGAIYQLVK